MSNLLIHSCLTTLQSTETLLNNLPNHLYSDTSVAPYYSSIGSHVRHILDFYNCIVKEKEGRVDLTNRERNSEVETNCETALEYLDYLQKALQRMDIQEDRQVLVSDDLGCGSIELKYTIGALMAQANSHTIHHYAIINYILERLGISLENTRFGFNPTTPVSEKA